MFEKGDRVRVGSDEGTIKGPIFLKGTNEIWGYNVIIYGQEFVVKPSDIEKI